MSANPTRTWSDSWSKEQWQLTHTLMAEVKKSGELIHQPCRVCGAPHGIAHHENYNQPLAVVWLCRSHHVKLHLELDPSIEIRGGRALPGHWPSRMHGSGKGISVIKFKPRPRAQCVVTSPGMTPTARFAHQAVTLAIKSGELRKQPCEACGAGGIAHYDDKPLDVRWLCHRHTCSCKFRDVQNLLTHFLHLKVRR